MSTYYQRNREKLLNQAKEDYENNNERLWGKVKNKYRESSNKKKIKKRKWEK